MQQVSACANVKQLARSLTSNNSMECITYLKGHFKNARNLKLPIYCSSVKYFATMIRNLIKLHHTIGGKMETNKIFTKAILKIYDN